MDNNNNHKKEKSPKTPHSASTTESPISSVHHTKKKIDKKKVVYASGVIGLKGDLASLEGKVPELSYTDIEPFIHDERNHFGHGSFGKVYKGVIRGTSVAIKAIRPLPDHANPHKWQNAMEELRSEIEIMARIRHKNVVRFYGMVKHPKDKDTRFLVSELLEMKNMGHIIKDRIPIPMFKRLLMVKNTAEGMLSLHTGVGVKIIHFDLKPENLLLDRNWNVKIADFGLSKAMLTNQVLKASQGTLLYRSPELLRNEPVTTATDVWSFGLCAYAIITGLLPYPDIHEERELVRRVGRNGEHPALKELINVDKEAIPAGAIHILKNCLRFHPEDRWDFQKILEELDNVIILEAIRDTQAARFWKKLRSKYQSQSDLVFFPFESLISAADAELNSTKAVVIQEFFANPVGSKLGSKKHMCHILDFGLFIKWFGPWDNDIFTRAEYIMRQPWFYGYLTKDAAANLLSNTAKGTYLIRSSITHPDSPFTISVSVSSNESSVQRIMRNKEGKYYVENMGSAMFSKKEKKTLIMSDSADLVKFVVEKLTGPLKLKYPLPGSPFVAVETEEVIDLGYLSD